MTQIAEQLIDQYLGEVTLTSMIPQLRKIASKHKGHQKKHWGDAHQQSFVFPSSSDAKAFKSDVDKSSLQVDVRSPVGKEVLVTKAPRPKGG